MLGDKCVAIACDLRLGSQALTINCDFEKVRQGWCSYLFVQADAIVGSYQVFEITPRTYAGFPGLATDTLTVSVNLKALSTSKP